MSETNYKEEQQGHVDSENREAKQRMNAKYIKETGEASKFGIINFFDRGSVPFQILSVLFSAFGFYYDLLGGVGIFGAITMAIGLGLFIELLKHYGVKGVFAIFKNPNWNVFFFGLTFVTSIVAFTMHYKSLDNYRNISVKSDIQERVDKDDETTQKKLDAIMLTQTNNTKLASLLEDGKIGNDARTGTSIDSNNKLAQSIMKMDTESTSAVYLKNQSEKSANIEFSVLLFIFIMVEIFSLAGMIAKALLSSETGKGVKSIRNTMSRLLELEENMTKVAETVMINQTMGKMERLQIGSHGVANPNPNNQYPSKTMPTLPYNKNMPSGAYSYANKYEVKQLPAITNGTTTTHKTPEDSIVDDKSTNNESTIKSNKKGSDDDSVGIDGLADKGNGGQSTNRTETNNKKQQEEVDTSRKTLDLLLLSANEQEIAKAMFMNGAVHYGDPLLQKAMVNKEFVNNRFITRNDIHDLYEKLGQDGMRMIEHKGGFRSVCNLANGVVLLDKDAK